jgi:hypothetical protein
MQLPKIVLGFAYTRCRANSHYNFWKRSRLSEKKREKERVTPEFGERKEEKNLPQIQGVTSVHPSNATMRESSYRRALCSATSHIGLVSGHF